MESAKNCADGQCCAESASKDEAVKALEIRIEELEALCKKRDEENLRLLHEKFDVEIQLKAAKAFIKTLL